MEDEDEGEKAEGEEEERGGRQGIRARRGRRRRTVANCLRQDHSSPSAHAHHVLVPTLSLFRKQSHRESFVPKLSACFQGAPFSSCELHPGMLSVGKDAKSEPGVGSTPWA